MTASRSRAGWSPGASRGETACRHEHRQPHGTCRCELSRGERGAGRPPIVPDALKLTSRTLGRLDRVPGRDATTKPQSSLEGDAVVRNEPEGPWPRIGFWGRFDVTRFGESLLARVHEVELQKRIPGLKLLAFSPIGCDHPISLDAGLTIEPFGAWSPERAASLASTTDAVIITGSDVLTTDDRALAVDYGLLESEALRRRISAFFIPGPAESCPTAWSAVGVPSAFSSADAPCVRNALANARYVSVRDDLSRKRLLDAGFRGDVTVVPDPVALVSRIFEANILARRLDYLRLMGWFPRKGAPIAVQVSAALFVQIDPLLALLEKASAAQDAPILFFETEPVDDGGACDALAGKLHSAFRLPASVSMVDVIAAFSASCCFVGDSVYGHLAAAGFGVPSLFLSPDSLPPALAALDDAAPATAHTAEAGPALARLMTLTHSDRLSYSVESRLRRHFDTLAEVANRALTERLGRHAKAGKADDFVLLRALQDSERRLATMRAAWESRSRQLVATRLEGGGRLEALERRLAEVSREREEAEGRLHAASEILASRDAALESERAEVVRLGQDLGSVTASRDAALTEAGRLRAEREVLESQLREAAERIESLLTECWRLQQQMTSAENELKAMGAEFVRFTNLRVFRYSAPLRRVYAFIRRALGLGRR